MSLLSPLGLPKISATIAVGNFFVSRSAFSRYRLIPKLTFTRLQSSSASRLYYGMSQTESEYFTFGPYKIKPSEVFYSTVLSRVVKRFVDLTANETTDLWLVAKEVGDKLERHHKASSLTFAIQDGPQAGQTVPHVHIHIIPRRIGDFEKNDEIYEAIDMKEKHLKDKLDLDISREDRTYDEMAREADEYRVLFS